MCKDLFEKCVDFVERPRSVSDGQVALAADLFSAVSPPANAGPWVKSEDAPYLQFSTNDYLGLASDPEVQARGAEAARQYGVSSPMGSRAMTGTTALHLELESQIAAFKRCEEALTFTTGSMAMMGMMAALAGPGDTLFMDQFAHASLVCGARISGATIVFFRHNDLDHLERLLSQRNPDSAAAIVVDGVYSMQGHLAPLPALVELKSRHGVRLIVDDAHGTGVFGPQGRGTAAHFGVEAGVDVHAGTFSKALATMGGFVAGDRAVIEYLRFNAPTMLFTKAAPLAIVAATRESLSKLEKADAQRERLHKNAKRLQEGLMANGFDIGGTQSPITPIQFCGNEALEVAHELRRAHRIWVSPVVYPAVEMGKSIIRIIPTARHTPDDVDFLIDSLMAV